MGCDDEAHATARLLSALDALCATSDVAGAATHQPEQDIAVRSAVREYAQCDDWHRYACAQATPSERAD
jgi:hypothetical protein